MRYLYLALAAACCLPGAAWAASPFDGTYSGTSMAEFAVVGCSSQPKSISIEVRGDQAWTHHHRMTGSVDSSGHLSLQGGDGRSQLIASIAGNSLTGTETVTTTPKKLRGFDVQGDVQCTRSVSAERQ